MRVNAARLIGFFARSAPRLYVVMLPVTLAASVFESLSVAAFLPLLQGLLNPNGVAPSGLLQQRLTAWTRMVPCSDPVLASAALILLVMACKFGLILLRDTLVARGAGRLLMHVKERLMARYAAAPYPALISAKQGVLVYNCVQAPRTIALLMLMAPQLAAELLKMVAMIALLCLLWWKAAAVLLAVVGGFSVVSHHLTKRFSYFAGHGRAQAGEEQMIVMNEFFTGIRQIKTFRTVDHWLSRFHSASRRFTTLYVWDVIMKSLAYHLIEVSAVGLLVGAVIMLRWWRPASLAASLPVLGVFSLALLRLLPSVSNFSRQRMEMLGTLADAERVHAALTEPSVRAAEGERPFETLRSRIAFEDVSFAHEGRAPLLTRLNLAIEKGRVTAIVGASGVGKSTMVNLLLGLFQPTEGRITVDGIPLSDYRLATWLGRIGFVSQEPFIYHATVADNILFGRAGYSREEVVKAAKIAHAHAFITELPQGYGTVVGERGMKLSGGQQQRLAIARAVLGDPEILIFDEATSHLDAVAEQQVQTAIEQISKDHTAVIVAHRLSTVRSADQIVVVDQGRIVEQGKHEELLSEQGHYFHLVASGAGLSR